MAGYLATMTVAYLLGSIPFGFLVARARGVDIRQVGSGNIGATNVFRMLGRPAGLLVLVADALKGWLAVVVLTRLVWRLLGLAPGPEEREYHAIVAGFGAILGHNYTCWLRFKGGKGIATSAGVLAALVPWGLCVALAIWVLVLLAWRYVSLASITASFALPFAVRLTGGSWRLVAVTAAMGALAIYKHRSNLRRLRNGTENKFKLREAGS